MGIRNKIEKKIKKNKDRQVLLEQQIFFLSLILSKRFFVTWPIWQNKWWKNILKDLVYFFIFVRYHYFNNILIYRQYCHVVRYYSKPFIKSTFEDEYWNFNNLVIVSFFNDFDVLRDSKVKKSVLLHLCYLEKKYIEIQN